MANDARTAWGLVALVLTSCLASVVSAEGAVEIENPIWLAEFDLGLEAVAAGGDSGQKVLVAGADGYARLTVPPMIWVGFQGLGRQTSLVLNIANIEHSPEEVERKELDEIKFNWSKY